MIFLTTLYQPVCSVWQKERCALLGLTLVHVNHSHWTQPSMMSVSHCPLATARIAAGGNCFFQLVSLAVYGSQEFYEELRLLITTYMIHKSTDPMLSSLGYMYLDQSIRKADQECILWALIATASLLNITIF